jgi:EmrB/QacA subfamily drug resistance transporter
MIAFQQASGKRKAVIMGSVMLGLFVSAVDQTVVSTAMPRIVAQLGGLSLFSWVFTAYMLTSTTSVPIVGKLGDLYGRKLFFMAGIGFFMLASMLAGLSQSMLQLIVFRGVQGLGAGMIMANAFAIIGDFFPPAERAKYQGLFAAVFGLASVCGPTIGGTITDHLNWRWVFYVNVPVGLVALPVLWVALPGRRAGGVRRPVDWAGVVTLTAGVVPLLLALVWGGNELAWRSPQIVGLLATAAVMTVLFVLAEARAQEPLLPLALFRNRIVSVCLLVVFVVGVGMFGVTVFVPLFVQGVTAGSATASGVVTVPMMLGMVVMSNVAGQIVSRTGRYRVMAIGGIAVALVGLVLLSRMGTHTGRAEVARNMVIIGTGMGMTMPTFNVAAQNAVPYSMLGVATAALQFFRSLGGTVGVALLGTVLTNRLRPELARGLPADVTQQVPAELVAQLRDPQTLLNPERFAQVRQGFLALGTDGSELFLRAAASTRVALGNALSHVFLIGALIVLCGLACSFLLREIPLRRTHEPRRAPDETVEHRVAVPLD